jgi:Coenzyme PQQ synthesis protein D (PqqD)
MATAKTNSVRPRESVKSARDADGGVLLDTRQGTCYGTNTVGSRIWQQLTEGSSVDQIVEQLHADFEVPKTQLHSDVNEFIAQLRDKGLLAADRDLERSDRNPLSAILDRLKSVFKSRRARRI